MGEFFNDTEAGRLLDCGSSTGLYNALRRAWMEGAFDGSLRELHNIALGHSHIAQVGQIRREAISDLMAEHEDLVSSDYNFYDELFWDADDLLEDLVFYIAAYIDEELTRHHLSGPDKDWFEYRCLEALDAFRGGAR